MSKAGRCHKRSAPFARPRLMPSFSGDLGNVGYAMTAKMLLHWSPRSPFVRKVMIVAHEVGVADRIQTLRTVVAASEPNVELMKENPQSRLPTLRLGDGTVIYDSPVICEYFDTLNPGD